MSPGEFAAWLSEERHRPLVMGVLNVTPDSFSDGGKFATVDAAVARAADMVAEGADLIDVGGESTRPGARDVPPTEQIQRVKPVLERICAELSVACSIDTRSSEVADAAIDAGASLVNDVQAGRGDPRMLALLARRGAAVILMHMLGTPQTMQVAPVYGDVVREVRDFLAERLAAARAAGIGRHKILIDPGIGFGKNLAHTLQLFQRQKELLDLGVPLVIGASRKGFIGKITGAAEPAGRLYGSLASVAWAVANGAAMVRVHDVAPSVQVVQMVRAMMSGRAG